MEIRSLRYFQAVFEFGNYSRAAGFLRISQPAVSRQVTRLEEELGKPLFVRTSHGVTPTEAGRVLFERSQAILRQLDRASAEVRDAPDEPAGTLAVAVPPGAGHFLVPALVRRYRESHPNVFLRLLTGFSGTIHEWLVRGRIDLACLHGPVPQRGFEMVPLIEEEVFLVGRGDALPADQERLRPRDLARLPLILPSRPNASRRLIETWLSGLRVAPEVVMEADDTLLIRMLLRAGVGHSLMCRGSFEGELEPGGMRALPLRPAHHWPLALMWSTTRPRSELVDAFIETLQATVRDLATSGEWPGRLLLR